MVEAMRDEGQSLDQDQKGILGKGDKQRGNIVKAKREIGDQLELTGTAACWLPSDIEISLSTHIC